MCDRDRRTTHEIYIEKDGYVEVGPEETSSDLRDRLDKDINDILVYRKDRSTLVWIPDSDRIADYVAESEGFSWGPRVPPVNEDGTVSEGYINTKMRMIYGDLDFVTHE